LTEEGIQVGVVVGVVEVEEEEDNDQRAEIRPSLRKKEGGRESFRVCVWIGEIYVWLVKKRGQDIQFAVNGGV
jgi:hypothetical protein